jgi:hypothetical protein
VRQGAFLDGIPLRPIALPAGGSIEAVGLALGQRTSPLEVVIANTTHPAERSDAPFETFHEG